VATRPSHTIIDLLFAFAIGVFVVAGISSCQPTCYDDELNQNEENIDCGGVCVPCDTSGGTCFDGLQNQGEEGIDCGGPCSPCIDDTSITNPQYICNGNGSSSYFPLTLNSYWIYSMPNNQWFMLQVTEEAQKSNGEMYWHVLTTGAFGTINDYFREVNGQVYRWNEALSAEEVYLPANPTAGMQWSTANTDSIVIDAVSATLSSQNGCDYTNLLKVITYSGGSTSGSTSYYKQGIGLIEIASAQAYLDSVVIY